MLRFASIAGLAVLFATAASAQVAPDVIYPAVARSATSAQGFVPAGWVLEQEVSGDLNGDGRADLALVLHMNNPANVVALGDGSDADTFDSNPRILAVALAQGSGYRLLVANHALIPRVDNYARTDPLDDSGGMLLVTGAMIAPIVLGALAYAVARRRWDALLCGAVAVAGFAVLKWTVFSPFHGC